MTPPTKPSPHGGPGASSPPNARPPHPAAGALPGADVLVRGRKHHVGQVSGVENTGVVMDADPGALGRKIARRFLAPGRGSGSARFAREARAAARADSKDVARVSDVDVLEPGAADMVVARLDGEDVSADMQRVGPRPTDEALLYAVQACDALAAAHAAHRARTISTASPHPRKAPPPACVRTQTLPHAVATRAPPQGGRQTGLDEHSGRRRDGLATPARLAAIGAGSPPCFEGPGRPRPAKPRPGPAVRH